MTLTKRIAELLNALSSNLLEKDVFIRIGFLSVLTEQPICIYGRSGSGKSLLIQRLENAFKFLNILPIGKRNAELPEKLDSYNMFLFSDFNCNDPFLVKTAHIAFQEHKGKAVIISTNQRPDACLTRADIQDNVHLTFSLPDSLPASAIRTLLSNNQDPNQFHIPVGLTVSLEEKKDWISGIQKIQLSEEALQLIENISEACEKNHIYISIRKWNGIVSIIKGIAFFNERSTTDITDTFFLGIPIWIKKAHNEIISQCILEHIDSFITQYASAEKSDEKYIENYRRKVEHALHATGDIYDTIVFNNIPCLQYSITIASESINIYVPADYIGTSDSINPFNEQHKIEKRVLCNFNRSNICSISIDATAKAKNFRFSTDVRGKTFETYAKLPARVLTIDDPDRISENSLFKENLKQDLTKAIQKRVLSLRNYQELYKKIKTYPQSPFFIKNIYEKYQEGIQTHFSSTRIEIKELTELQQKMEDSSI